MNGPQAQFITTEICLLYIIQNIKWNYDRIILSLSIKVRMKGRDFMRLEFQPRLYLVYMEKQIHKGKNNGIFLFNRPVAKRII